MSTTTISKPSWFLYLTEGIRAFIDFLRCIFYLSYYDYKKIGDERPIIVVPRLTTSDLSMGLLRRFLKKHHFTHVYPWGLGRNWGHLDRITLLSEKVEQLHAQHQQKVTLIGWSLGGVFCREIAKQKPEIIAQLITMGSPFGDEKAPNNALWLYQILHDMTKIDPVWWSQIPQPAPVPTTAIFTKNDGIVPWQVCREQEDELHKNAEVSCSHFGLPVCPDVLKIVLKVLSH